MPNSAGSDVVVVGNVGIDTNVYLPAPIRIADAVAAEGNFASDLDHARQVDSSGLITAPQPDELLASVAGEEPSNIVERSTQR